MTSSAAVAPRPDSFASQSIPARILRSSKIRRLLKEPKNSAPRTAEPLLSSRPKKSLSSFWTTSIGTTATTDGDDDEEEKEMKSSGSVTVIFIIFYTNDSGYERTGAGENDWQTVDNSTDFFAKWKDGEPDNDDENENCAEIDIDEEEMSDVDCDDKERKFSCRQDLIPGEIIVKDREICECTERGVECENLSRCPEFVRMDGAANYTEAKAQCAEMNGHVAFFEAVDEFDKFMDDDNFKRKEWIGNSNVYSNFDKLFRN
jgi:hypothetical protein